METYAVTLKRNYISILSYREYQYWLEPGRPVVEQVPGANLDIIILHFGAM